MKAAVLRRLAVLLLAGLGGVSTAFMSGCGGGERMESGTQVEVTQDMLDEADASDAYFDSQTKGGSAK